MTWPTPIDPEQGSTPWPVGPVRHLRGAPLTPRQTHALLCLVGGPCVSSASGFVLASLRRRGLIANAGAASSPRGRRPLWALTPDGWAAIGRTP